jgi:hypothetical protein
MSEELETLEAVAERLDRARIPYMVTGSIAMNYYAVPRMTRDIDVVIELGSEDVDRVCDMFQQDFYVDREAVRRAVAQRSMFNVIHTETVIKVDFVVRKESPYRLEEFARRRRVSIAGHGLSIVAPEDLVISKLDWARDTRSEVQLADVRNLLESVRDLDRAYLEAWTRRLGLEALYREAGG